LTTSRGWSGDREENAVEEAGGDLLPVELTVSRNESSGNALRTKLRRLISNEPRLGERLEVHSMDANRRAPLQTERGPRTARLGTGPPEQEVCE
jgi:hypothetical protein